MARKPKVIETPGDTAPVSDAAKVAAHLMAPPANPEGKGTPQPEAATPTGSPGAPTEPAEYTANGLKIFERRAGWILTQYGWTKE